SFLLSLYSSLSSHIPRPPRPTLFPYTTLFRSWITNRPNTRLIQLPPRRQTVRIFKEFVLGRHDILFYLKSSPASKWYLRLRRKWGDTRITIGTVESQSDLRNQPATSLGGLGASTASSSTGIPSPAIGRRFFFA